MQMIAINDDGRIDRIITDPTEFDRFWQIGGVRVISVLEPVDLDFQTIGGVPVADLVAKHGLPPKLALRPFREEKPIRSIDPVGDAERATLQHLVNAWNSFLALSVEHNDDIDEFRRIIHAAQEKVLARPARRQINGGL